MEKFTDIWPKYLEKIANDSISNLRVGSIETIKIYNNHPRCAETVFINTSERILEIMKHCDFRKVASKEEFWKSIYLLYLSAEAKSNWDSILAFNLDNNLVIT